MDKATKQEMKNTKITVKIWEPVIEKLERKLEEACLRRDAYLAKVLEKELPHLDNEVHQANSAEAYAYISKELDTLKRRSVSLALPPETAQKLGDICKRKNINRDAFFNRLFLLLATKPRVVDLLIFNGDTSWRKDTWNSFDHDEEFLERSMYPLSSTIDPFLYIRSDIEASTTKTSLSRDSDQHEMLTIYTIELKNQIKDVSLVGLSCYLPDHLVPGHPAEKEMKVLLDEMFSQL